MRGQQFLCLLKVPLACSGILRAQRRTDAAADEAQHEVGIADLIG